MEMGSGKEALKVYSLLNHEIVDHAIRRLSVLSQAEKRTIVFPRLIFIRPPLWFALQFSVHLLLSFGRRLWIP